MSDLKKYGLLLLGGILCLATCEFNNTYRWQEQVQLSDGKVIWIERRIVGKGGGWRDSDFEASKDEVKVVDAAGLNKPPLWSDRWAPMILDRDEQGSWYMVVAPIHCHDWNSNFPYRQYKAVNGRWQQVDFDMRLDRRRPNIEWYIRLKKMPQKLYLTDKPEWEKGGGRVSPEFQIISPQYRVDC